MQAESAEDNDTMFDVTAACGFACELFSSSVACKLLQTLSTCHASVNGDWACQWTMANFEPPT